MTMKIDLLKNIEYTLTKNESLLIDFIYQNITFFLLCPFKKYQRKHIYLLLQYQDYLNI